MSFKIVATLSVEGQPTSYALGYDVTDDPAYMERLREAFLLSIRETLKLLETHTAQDPA